MWYQLRKNKFHHFCQFGSSVVDRPLTVGCAPLFGRTTIVSPGLACPSLFLISSSANWSLFLKSSSFFKISFSAFKSLNCFCAAPTLWAVVRKVKILLELLTAIRTLIRIAAIRIKLRFILPLYYYLYPKYFNSHLLKSILVHNRLTRVANLS